MENFKNLNINDIEGEIWKDINGYVGLYQVSNIGRIKSLKYNNTNKEKILTNILTVKGYYKVKLGKNNTKLVHRLVAEAFIPNPDNKPEVNHIKGIKTDNRITELEWNTRIENNQHAFKTGLKVARKGKECNFYGNRKLGKENHLSKEIYQYTLDNIFIKKWDSIIDVNRELKIFNISTVAKGKKKSAGGFRWSYTKL